jgi:heterodisulfide reductase subunit A
MSADTILVVGGGPAGLEAARGAADLGSHVVLVERRDRLGGTPDAAGFSAFALDDRPVQEVLEVARQAVLTHPRVTVHLGTEVSAFAGEAGAFRATLRAADGSTSVVDCGAVIVATGFDHFDPGRETQAYGYYEYEDVITLVDADKMLATGRFVRPSTGEPPEQVCFIQCVGSRDRRIGNEYCSKVCCAVATKEASEIRALVPGCRIFIFYIDMRTYGFWEDRLYWKAQEQDHVNFVRGLVTEVTRRGDQLVIKGEDTTMGRPMEIPMDVVILSVGMVPSEGTRAIGPLLGVAQEKHGFIAPLENALDSVSTSVPGIFVAGAAAGPKDLDDSVSMAGAAAMKAVGAVRGLAGAESLG